MQLIVRWPGMRAHFRDERDMALSGGIDAVDHEVAGARHLHQVHDALNDERGIRAIREGAQARLAKLIALAVPEADRSAFRANEHKTDSGTLGKLFSEPRKSLLESVEGKRGDIKKAIVTLKEGQKIDLTQDAA